MILFQAFCRRVGSYRRVLKNLFASQMNVNQKELLLWVSDVDNLYDLERFMRLALRSSSILLTSWLTYTMRRPLLRQDDLSVFRQDDPMVPGAIYPWAMDVTIEFYRVDFTVENFKNQRIREVKNPISQTERAGCVSGRPHHASSTSRRISVGSRQLGEPRSSS